MMLGAGIFDFIIASERALWSASADKKMYYVKAKVAKVIN